jgi:hypothetical protein
MNHFVGENMTFRIMLIGVSIIVLSAGVAGAQGTEVTLPLSQILQKADSVSNLQDSLLHHAKYKVREEFVFNELDDENNIKNADTAISVVTMEGNKEISREIVYSTKQPNGEKKNDDDKKEISFSYTNPDYNFSLTGTDETSYIIAMSPKKSPAKGDITGTVKVDRRSFETRAMAFTVPKPDGALKEFATSMSFEPMEGGLLVLREMRMKGFVKMFLGIVKMRFSGEVHYSNFEALK